MINIVIGNILVVFQYLIFNYYFYKYNDKKTVLKGDIISCITAIIANWILGATAAAISMTVTAIRLFIIYYKEKYNKTLFPVFILLCGLYLTTFVDFKGFQTILLVISMFCSFIPKWFSKNVQFLRLGGLLGNITIIPYDFMVQNYVGCCFATFNIVMLSISLIKWIFKKDEVNNE